MSTILETFQVNNNYWEVNPTHLLIPEFKKIYDIDTSENKFKSSKLLWAIALYIDIVPKSNPYRNLKDSERKVLVETNFLGASLDSYTTLISKYKELCVTPIRRALQEFLIKLDDRNRMLAETAYTIENAQVVDKLLANTNTLNDTYNDLVEKVNKEMEVETNLKNNRSESLSERGLI